jgi:cytochrome b6-f complex iron-sulfur subunit
MAEAAGEDAFVPDMDRRKLMNAILLGSVGLNVLGLAVPYIAFFVPRTGGGA